jgi:DNA modification methylase
MIEFFKVWENNNELFCLDGYHRCLVLKQLEKDGYKIPEKFNADFMECKNKKHAAKLVGIYSSIYARVTEQGLYQFIHDHDLDFAEFKQETDIPDIDIDKFEASYFDTAQYGDDPENDNAVPEVNENPFTKLGDLIELGNHRLLCGDSTVKENVDRLMDGEKAEFCFTSPPYSDQRDYNGKLELDPKHLAKFLDAPCKLFAVNLGMCRKNGEVFPYWDNYIRYAKNKNMKFLSWNVWDRLEAGGIGNQTAMFEIDHEWIFIFGERKDLNRTVPHSEATKDKYKYGASTRRLKSGELKDIELTKTHNKKQLATVSRICLLKARNVDNTHPAMFPVELPVEYIKACSNEKDLIYEPFAGSGSTLIACEKTNRKCFMMELDPHYCDVIIKRWCDYTGNKEYKRNGKVESIDLITEKG